jgi:hypothetical protein
MTAGRLRNLTMLAGHISPATTPVRFQLPDGTVLAFERAEYVPPPHTPATDSAAARYTGPPTLVLVLRQ